MTRSASPLSPRTSTLDKSKLSIPPGFRPLQRPTEHKPIEQLSERELNDLHLHNERTLSSQLASSSKSNVYSRIGAEQAAIEARLTLIAQQHNAPTSDKPRILEVKRRVIERSFGSFGTSSNTAPMGMSETIRLQREQWEWEQEKQRKAEEKRNALIPKEDEKLTEAERHARIWAYLHYKDSDEDEDEEDEDGEEIDEDELEAALDRAFEEEEEEPDLDMEDLASVIKVDESKVPTAYRNRGP